MQNSENDLDVDDLEKNISNSKTTQSKTQGSEKQKWRVWEKIIAIFLAIIGSGLIGSWITSMYSDKIAKREITAKVLTMISDNLFKTTTIPTKIEDATKEQLSELLTRKEHAFFIRKTTDYLLSNYPKITFNDILPAITEIETRYSNARIYKAAKMVDILCENLYFSENRKRKIVLSADLGKAYTENILFLDELTIELVWIDVGNQNFRIKITNDHGNYLCHPKSQTKKECEFTVDLTDRLENLPYEHMIITEYIGYIDPIKESDPIVFFSIVRNKEQSDEDRSYWENVLPISELEYNNDNCESFFDHDDSTNSKPLPPELDVFDRGVLRACGPIGGEVTREEFKQLIYDNFDLIIKSLKNPPSDWKNKTKFQIINDLHRIWTLYGGFNHIFCGDWDRGSIGGLHDRSRYLQLQMEGEACYLKSPLEDILPDNVYTIGVRSKDYRFIHEIKGYSLNKSSIELFIFATKAFYELCNTSQDWGLEHEGVYSSRLYEKNFFVDTKENKKIITYRILFYATNRTNPLTYGIKTIYPDLTPDNGYKRVVLSE